MIPPKPLSSKVWVSGRGLARDWQASESGRCQPVLKKQRARDDIECGDFGLAGGTVGWVLPLKRFTLDKPSEFARE
jgi:hypothetical protein